MTSENISYKRFVNRSKPLLVVFSAPSGAGKSTIVNELIKKNRKFCKSISATTRERRKGERNNRDYFFLTEKEFRNKTSKGGFIETAKVFTNLYGTPKDYVLQSLKKGKTVLFDIDIQGGKSIKKWRSDAVLIFILPPDIKTLRQRLTKRKSETKENLELRLSLALKEIRLWSKYDYVVCNDKLNETVEIIEQIIRAESQNSIRFTNTDFNK